MQQFSVPKYINLEAHILGPLSLAQTATVILAGAIVLILYVVLESFLFVPAAIIVGFAAMTISFGRINGRPMSDFLFSVLAYDISPRLYIWTLSGKKTYVEQKNVPPEKRNEEKLSRPISMVTPEQIHALAQTLDVLKK